MAGLPSPLTESGRVHGRLVFELRKIGLRSEPNYALPSADSGSASAMGMIKSTRGVISCNVKKSPTPSSCL